MNICNLEQAEVTFQKLESVIIVNKQCTNFLAHPFAIEIQTKHRRKYQFGINHGHFTDFENYFK